jgi:hypothetical protein
MDILNIKYDENTIDLFKRRLNAYGHNYHNEKYIKLSCLNPEKFENTLDKKIDTFSRRFIIRVSITYCMEISLNIISLRLLKTL